MVGSLFVSKRCTFPREPPLPTLDFAADGSLQYTSVQPSYKGIFTGYNVTVQAEGDMISLYTKGYFGKGSLSQSYPSYHKRLQRILNANKGAEESAPDSVKATEAAHSVNVVIEERNSDVLSDDSGNVDILNPRETDVSSLDASSKEELHLTLEEAFFLAYALNCLQIFYHDEPMDLDTVWSTFGTVQANFVERYVAYHHFRSKGWVVRSGVKYGADYVLYKDGPSYYHATYVVFVSNGRTDTSFYLTCYRAVEVTKKDLLLCHVQVPEKIGLDRLNECQISEYVLKRWIPSENRNPVPRS